MTLEEALEWVTNTFDDNYPLSEKDKEASIEALVKRVYKGFNNELSTYEERMTTLWHTAESELNDCLNRKDNK